MITELGHRANVRRVASRPAVDLVWRVIVIAVLALGILIGLPLVVTFAG